MKKIMACAVLIGAGLIAQPMLNAATLILQWDGSGAANSNVLALDDTGGYENAYSFVFNGVSHTSESNIILSDGSGIAVGDSSLAAPDFVGAGLTAFAGPFAAFPNVDQVLLQSDAPLTPVTMSANNTSLSVQQIVYVNNTKDYAILELRAVNNGVAATPVFVAFTNDWDVGDTSSNDNAFFDASRNMVAEQATAGNYSVGMASLNNAVDQYHLGGCCGLSDTIVNNVIFPDIYTLPRHFLNNSKSPEACDDGNDDPADGGNDTCTPKCNNPAAGQVCGNGSLEGDEECDDGDLDDGDDCDHRCLIENGLCGNGSVDPGEECDDGNRLADIGNPDGCSLDCTYDFSASDSDFCGDGFVNNGATGNQIDSAQYPGYDIEVSLSVKFPSVAPSQSGTAAFCLIGATGTDLADSQASLENKADDCLDFYQQNIAICGNGLQNAGEACDDGNTTDGDGCASDCTLDAQCGNGQVEDGEACDDGNAVDDDACSNQCSLGGANCGNGVVDDGEECDDGNGINNDTCDNACETNAVSSDDGGCTLGLGASSGLGFWSLLPAALLALSFLRRRSK